MLVTAKQTRRPKFVDRGGAGWHSEPKGSQPGRTGGSAANEDSQQTLSGRVATSQDDTTCNQRACDNQHRSSPSNGTPYDPTRTSPRNGQTFRASDRAMRTHNALQSKGGLEPLQRSHAVTDGAVEEKARDANPERVAENGQVDLFDSAFPDIDTCNTSASKKKQHGRDTNAGFSSFANDSSGGADADNESRGKKDGELKHERMGGFDELGEGGFTKEQRSPGEEDAWMLAVPGDAWEGYEQVGSTLSDAQASHGTTAARLQQGRLHEADVTMLWSQGVKIDDTTWHSSQPSDEDDHFLDEHVLELMEKSSIGSSGRTSSSRTSSSSEDVYFEEHQERTTKMPWTVNEREAVASWAVENAGESLKDAAKHECDEVEDIASLFAFAHLEDDCAEDGGVEAQAIEELEVKSHEEQQHGIEHRGRKVAHVHHENPHREADAQWLIQLDLEHSHTTEGTDTESESGDDTEEDAEGDTETGHEQDTKEDTHAINEADADNESGTEAESQSSMESWDLESQDGLLPDGSTEREPGTFVLSQARAEPKSCIKKEHHEDALSKASASTAGAEVGLPLDTQVSLDEPRHPRTWIQMGSFLLEPWVTDFQCSAGSQRHMRVCERCLRTFDGAANVQEHLRLCDPSFGTVIFTCTSFEVRMLPGTEHTGFLRQLCWLSSAFNAEQPDISDIARFNFFVFFTTTKEVAGYFTRHRRTAKPVSLCWMGLFPQYENTSFLKAMIDLSHELCLRCGSAGSPERPLDVLAGEVQYREVWCKRLLSVLISRASTTRVYTLLELAQHTGIGPYDVAQAIQRLGAVHVDQQGRKYLFIDPTQRRHFSSGPLQGWKELQYPPNPAAPSSSSCRGASSMG